MAYEDKYMEFEQYQASGEPGVEERARNWTMAIGLRMLAGGSRRCFCLNRL